MTEATHTPGPWSEGSSDWSVDSDGDNTCAAILADNREAPICLVVEGAAWGRDAQLDANARLIASAPDLLEALKALQLQALQSPDLIKTEWGKEALDLARAAIAKAESRP